MSSNSPSSSPPSKDDSSPPPSDDNSSSPPPPPDDNSSSSPPPPSEGGSSSPPPSNSSPPPPSDNNNNNGGDNNNNGNNNNNDNNNNGNDNNNNNNGGSNNNNNNGSGDNNNKKSPPPPSSPNKNSNGPPPPPPPPPRPPRHGKALAPPQTSDDSPSGDKGSDINTKALIGGVAGGAALLLVFMILCMVCCCRKKKRKSHDQMHYYRDNSHGNKTDYYNSGQHGNWVNQQSNDYHLKMPQPGSTAVSSEHGWAVPPPPPPPMTSSSELSSAAFSGPHGPALPPPHPSLALGFNKSTFSYDDLAAATGGFAKTNLLGQGGFGFVHKGVLPNGKEIAVKSLKSGSGQGEREFQAEVDIISRVHHRHLVSLVGYCIAGNQRMLVYEFVANDTLEHHLHGGGKVMDWPSRIRIALGSAKGFAYLHEDCHPRIIHRDIKASNILLDDHFEAKVADFGLAKLSNDNYTHVSTRIMGTFGYLAPEYASSGKLTEKSDVYSYGVMLLELITGRRPVDVTRDDDDTLIDWARPILMRAVEGGDYDELVDPRLENNYDPDEMLRMVACAASCIRHSARRRPKMSQIVRALEGDVSLEDLNEGTKPGHSALYGSSGSSEYDGSYNVDMKKFRKAGLSSQEFTSSEHGVTGEYAHSSGSESQEIRSNRSRMHSP